MASTDRREGDGVRVRNAVLHAILALGIPRVHPYDVDCVLSSLMADGMKIVPEDENHG